MKNKVEIIAFYLPQYHPFKENDEWWGKGFTEWTNVGKARPLFKGHYQPHVPADLGYYDLRLPQVREEQVKLAQEAGVYGFCYWHYWFGNGKQLLNLPFDEVLKSGTPKFPFCLGWANESWQSKIWNKDGATSVKKVLIEQTYPGVEDYVNHFNSFLNAFKDERYIRIEGRPLFYIYKPFLLPNADQFISLWNKRIKESGVADSFYFVAQFIKENEINELLSMGFDAVTPSPMPRIQYYYDNLPKFIRGVKLLYRKMFNKPVVINYSQAIKKIWKDDIDSLENVIPFIIPNWDHSPRSGNNALVLHDSNPRLFAKLCDEVISNTLNKENRLIFLKSWNEWGEGNYMEPDLKYGKGYIKALKKIIDRY